MSIFSIVLSVLVAAQATTAPATAPARGENTVVMSAVTDDDLKPTTRPYAISPNDLLRICVEPNDNTVDGDVTMHCRVNREGNISVKGLKDPIHVAGLTANEAFEPVMKAFRSSGDMPNARVEVEMLEARGHVFVLIGNIVHAGEFPIEGDDFRLSGALRRGGGVTKGNKVRVTRTYDTANGTRRVLDIKIDELEKPDSKVDIVIRPRDVIAVIDDAGKPN